MGTNRIAAACLLASWAGLAGAQTFTFESATPGFVNSYSESSGGLTMAISRPSMTFEVAFRTAYPLSWGSIAIFSTSDQGLAFDPLIVDFDLPLSALSLETGDFGADADTVTVTAYDAPGATGNVVATAVVDWGTRNFNRNSPAPAAPEVVSLSPSAGSIRSLTLSSVGFSGGQSMGYDNFIATVAGGACEPDLTSGAVVGQPGYGVPNGVLNNDDFFYYLAQFAAGNLAVADLTTGAVPGQPGYGVPNGVLNNDDFFYYLAIFAAGC